MPRTPVSFRLPSACSFCEAKGTIVPGTTVKGTEVVMTWVCRQCGRDRPVTKGEQIDPASGHLAAPKGHITGAERVRWILDRIASGGLLVPASVKFGQKGKSIAVAFTINGVTETIEGCGETDAVKADDVLRQLRQRLEAAGDQSARASSQ